MSCYRSTLKRKWCHYFTPFLLSFAYLFVVFGFSPLSFGFCPSVFPVQLFSSIVLVTYNDTHAFMIYFFASFSVARVSHDDEAKLSRERASDPLWVASEGIGRG